MTQWLLPTNSGGASIMGHSLFHISGATNTPNVGWWSIRLWNHQTKIMRESPPVLSYFAAASVLCSFQQSHLKAWSFIFSSSTKWCASHLESRAVAVNPGYKLHLHLYGLWVCGCRWVLEGSLIEYWCHSAVWRAVNLWDVAIRLSVCHCGSCWSIIVSREFSIDVAIRVRVKLRAAEHKANGPRRILMTQRWVLLNGVV